MFYNNFGLFEIRAQRLKHSLSPGMGNCISVEFNWALASGLGRGNCKAGEDAIASGEVKALGKQFVSSERGL